MVYIPYWCAAASMHTLHFCSVEPPRVWLDKRRPLRLHMTCTRTADTTPRTVHRHTCSMAGDAFGVAASPRISLAVRLLAALRRVDLSGSDRQLIVRCRVAIYCCTASCDSPAAAGSYACAAACMLCWSCCWWSAAAGCPVAAARCLLGKPAAAVEDGCCWCCWVAGAVLLGSMRVRDCTPGMPKPGMPVVTDLGTTGRAAARAAPELSSLHISSTVFFLVGGSCCCCASAILC